MEMPVPKQQCPPLQEEERTLVVPATLAQSLSTAHALDLLRAAAEEGAEEESEEGGGVLKTRSEIMSESRSRSGSSE